MMIGTRITQMKRIDADFWIKTDWLCLRLQIQLNLKSAQIRFICVIRVLLALGQALIQGANAAAQQADDVAQ